MEAPSRQRFENGLWEWQYYIFKHHRYQKVPLPSPMYAKEKKTRYPPLPTGPSKWSVVDQCHALMSCWDFYAARLRLIHKPADENISSTRVIGSGTVAWETEPSTAPLPGGWPK